MSSINDATSVGVVGSPSTNWEISLDILGSASHEPIVGGMLFLTHPLGAGEELALGTVTEVETTNTFHQNPLLRGVVKAKGTLTGMSGDQGDIRAATIKIQACYKHEGDKPWAQSGPSMRTSPPTGAFLKQINDDVISDLMAGEKDLHYLGRLHSTDVKIPMSMRDFSGERGAVHQAVFGLSGSGKALDLDTPIPTPTGWITMGELRDGDIVLDEQGNPTTVLKAHDIRLDRPCYEVVFSDGSVIVADAEHLWFTEDVLARRSQNCEIRKADSRVRRNVYSERVLARIRAALKGAKPEDVITISDVATLVGVSTASNVFSEITQTIRPVGKSRRPMYQTYAEQIVPRGRLCRMYPAVELFTALAELFDAAPKSASFGPVQAVLLRAAAESMTSGAVVRVADVGAVIGVDRRNGHLARQIVATGMRGTMRDITVQANVSARVVEKAAGPAATYPAQAFLSALIERGQRPFGDQRYKQHSGRVVTTEEILTTLKHEGTGATNHAIPVAAALNLPEADLPVGPYTLGMWLGDGHSWSTKYFSDDPEIALYIEDEGYGVHKTKEPFGYGVAGLHPGLKSSGLLKTYAGRKHIPAAYLRASETQRRALLAGLLDSDGNPSPQGTVHFDNTNRELVDGYFELVSSLGYRATITGKQAMLNGKDCGPTWRVAFTTADQVFRLERKQILHKERSQQHNPVKTGHRYITDVRPVESRPVRCITVNSPNSLYLAGKAMIPTHNTVFANYILAGQMRHRDLGMIIVDPQGQFSSETGFSFSLQGWAAEMGREVIVRRVSEDLRLEKDAPLFVSLLAKTKFTREIQKMAAETSEILMEEFAKVLKSYDGEWETEDSSTLLRSVIDSLRDPKKLKKVYADPSRQRRLLESLSDILGDIPQVDEGGNQVDPTEWDLATIKESERLFRELLSQFAPLHNLFSDKNPNGDRRHSMWGTITNVFDKSSRQGAPAPLLILDMSTSGNVSWLKSLVADADTAHAMEAIRVLDQDSIKASILSQVCRTLKNASEAAFREGETLNTMVVFDEAWRYAPPPHQASVVEIAELSKELAGYARDTRKFGIGWFYITQSPRSLNDDIWGQLSVRIMGYGLGGADLAKVAEQMDDPDHLKLYRGFAPPESTNPKVYPFMMVGPVSPLSFTKAPVFLSAYTDFDDFRLDNYQWIEKNRIAQGLPVREGSPAKAGGHILVPVSTRRKVSKGETDRAAEQVRAFGSTGGVNPEDSIHLSKDDGFSSASTALGTPSWATSAAPSAADVTHTPVPAAEPVQDVPGGLRLVTAHDDANDNIVDDTAEDNSAFLDGFLPVSPPDQEPF